MYICLCLCLVEVGGKSGHSLSAFLTWHLLNFFFFFKCMGQGGGSAGKNVCHEACQPESPPGPTSPLTVQNKRCLMCVCVCVSLCACVREQCGGSCTCYLNDKVSIDFY